MSKIEWTVKAIKQMGKIPTKEAEKITVAVRSLRDWPSVDNVKHYPAVMIIVYA